MQEFKLSWATGRGDLILMWKERELTIHGKLAGQKERDQLTTWAKEHGLLIEGDWPEPRIHAEPEYLKKALTDLVGKDVGMVGYIVYALTKKGKAKVIAHHSEVDLTKFTEVVRVPQARGG